MTLRAAGELIKLEKEASARMIDLARHLSLAAHVELELLRAMRLAVMPQEEAGIEADLWFSPLVQARDVGTLVLLPEVRTLLQLELAQHPEELEAARRVIEEKHLDLDAVVLLEERAVYYALKGGHQSFWEMQRQLGTVVRALNQAQDDPDLLRWVARTLPRLPERAKASEAAMVLHQQAARRLGGLTVAGIPEVTSDQWSAALVPTLPSVIVGLKMSPQGVWLSCPPEPDSRQIEIPDTSPLRIEVTWPVPAGWETHFVDLTPGGAAAFVEAPVGLLLLRSVQGDEVRLRPAAQGIFRPLAFVFIDQEDGAFTEVLRTELEGLGWNWEIVPLRVDRPPEPPKIFLSYRYADEQSMEAMDRVVASLRADGFDVLDYRERHAAETQGQAELSQGVSAASGAVLFLTAAALQSPAILEEATELLRRARARGEFRLVAVISERSALEELQKSPLRDALLLETGVQIILPDALENQVAQVRQAFAELRRNQGGRMASEEAATCLLSFTDHDGFERFIVRLRSVDGLGINRGLEAAVAHNIPVLVRVVNRLERLAPNTAPAIGEPEVEAAPVTVAVRLAEGLVSLRARLFEHGAAATLELGRELRREILAVEAEVLRRWVDDLFPGPPKPPINGGPIDTLTVPIREAHLPQLAPLLDNLQGNILRGHGRERTAHLFLQFRDGMQQQVREVIRGLAGQVTSAQRQLEEAERYRANDTPGDLFLNFLLSADGYRFLGLDLAGHGGAFAAGMKSARARLNDPSVEAWEAGYRRTIHAMVLLAHDDESLLHDRTQQLMKEITAIAEICAIEHGSVLRNEHGESVEHFGYVIGRSQPLFFQRDVERQVDGRDQWHPGAGPSLVIVKDPHGGNDAYGSYLVFRKLEQDVRGFKERERALAQALGLSGEEMERAGALAVGRFRDGTPLVLSPRPGLSNPPNNFTYADDPGGQRCPFHAHIRKVNPRGESAQGLQASYPSELQRRIARRGIPYRTRDDEAKDTPGLDDLPTGGVGLLFMCYQRDIGEQFEFLQSRWANNEDFVREKTGIDPIIGQPRARDEPLLQQWPRQWQVPPQTGEPFSFHGFVTLKGGEYFFVPSIQFLRSV